MVLAHNARINTVYAINKHPNVKSTLQGSNEVNKTLMARITDDGRVHMIPAETKGVYFLRFVVCAAKTTSADVLFDWDVIRDVAAKLLSESI